MSADRRSFDAVIVGAGPAGLLAADVISARGYSVAVAEAKPSPARKFLMAGKSGLNITKDERLEKFLTAYAPIHPSLEKALRAFGPDQVKEWMASLEQSYFIGSTGRVFPDVMKASPLLRAWLGRLERQGVEMRRQWRLVKLGDQLSFDTPNGPQAMRAKVTILAMGGASWARLGSDGAWPSLLSNKADIRPFLPSNAGLDVTWSDHMQQHMGKPIKGAGLSAGNYVSRGEFVISHRGLEGGGVYAVTRGVRQGAPLVIDLLPDWSQERVNMTLNQRKPKETTSKFLSRCFKLPPEKRALLMEFSKPTADNLGRFLKELPLVDPVLRPLDEAISTAGGLAMEELTEKFELRNLPGVFAAGEMLDWDAPTGGYLLTACLATGRHAALGALNVLQASKA